MESSGPKRAGLVLAALILVAAVANLNLAVANVALPDIGKAFNAGQTTLNLVAVGYSLGLATSVLYLGALGDRYGRKMMLLLGMGLSIPASLLAGFAPSIGVLFVARVLGGVAEFVVSCELRDGRTVWTDAGPGAERMLGGPLPEGADGPTVWHDCVHPDDRHIYDTVITAQSEGRVGTGVYRLAHEDGSIVHVRTQGAPSLDEHGRMIGLIGSLMDLTELVEGKP